LFEIFGRDCIVCVGSFSAGCYVHFAAFMLVIDSFE